MAQAIDWSGYNDHTTLREAFSMAGLVLFPVKGRPGFYVAHPRGKYNVNSASGYPKALYKWLHENHGCPCDSYWLE